MSYALIIKQLRINNILFTLFIFVYFKVRLSYNLFCLRCLRAFFRSHRREFRCYSCLRLFTLMVNRTTSILKVWVSSDIFNFPSAETQTFSR